MSCCFQMYWNILKELLFSLKCWYFSSLSYPFECIIITENRFIKLLLLDLMLSYLKSLCPRWEGHAWVWLNSNTLNTERGARTEQEKQDRITGPNSVLRIACAIPCDFNTCIILNCRTWINFKKELLSVISRSYINKKYYYYYYPLHPSGQDYHFEGHFLTLCSVQV